MTDLEKVARMAREAGMEQDGNNFFSPMGEEMDVHISDLERFFQAAYAAGAAAEREACARFVEDGYVRQFEKPWREDLAAAIRARGQA